VRHSCCGRIPGARLEVLAGARHAYFEECRKAASDLVETFIGI
jgi:hypothetical protein